MQLQGTHNFRDVGGMPLTSSGSIRSGVLYRSDALAALTDDDLGQLAESPIGVVVDFRTPAERTAAPDRLPTARPFTVVELSVLEGALTGMSQDSMKLAAQTGDAVAAADALAQALAHLPTLGQLYEGMLQHGAAAFAEVARLIGAQRDDVPSAVVLHCTAGKDRTGVSTALMLDVAGAERAAIVADYAASEANLAGPWADGMLARMTQMGVPVTPGIIELVTKTPPTAIEQAFDWVEANHGSSADYLRSGGVTDADLDALRARLIA